MCIYQSGCVLWYQKPCGLFNARSGSYIYIYIYIYTICNRIVCRCHYFNKQKVFSLDTVKLFQVVLSNMNSSI